MDFIKCPKYQSVTSCCGENTSMDGENESNEFRNKNSAFHERNNKIENTYPVLHTGPVRFTKDERSNEYSNVFLPLGMDKTNSIYQSCELPYGVKYELNNECMQEETVSSLEVEGIQEFHCPRCGKGMQEPRLLPCLHPICSPCVLELISKHVRVHSTQSSNYYEICPLCDFQLPNANSPIPPPHYPLQHRLVMDAIRSGFANKVLCDACTDEITVTCKECMWSMQHRGHASETATGAGKRVALYLKAVLQRAKTLLNILLTQYDQNMFLNSTLEEIKDIFASMDHRYVKLIT
nr:PREDICTED: uncharacterized protein LOC100876259 isoform X4 [Megachile rotundata]